MNNWLDWELAAIIVMMVAFFGAIVCGLLGHPVTATVLICIFAAGFVATLWIGFFYKD